MSLIKLASAYHGIVAAGKSLAANQLVRNTAIGASVGAIGGAMAGDKDHRLRNALLGATIGGAGAGAGTLAYQAHGIGKAVKAQGLKPGGFGSRFKMAAGVNRVDLGMMPEVYRSAKEVGTHNFKDPKLQQKLVENMIDKAIKGAKL
jgi:hypothetical protein